MHVKATKYELDFAIFFRRGVGGFTKTIQRFSTGFQEILVDLGKPKDILLHTLSALGNHPGLDGSVSIFSSSKFFRKTKKSSHLCLRILPPRGPVLWGDDG